MPSISERATASVKSMPEREQAEHKGRNRLVTDDEVGDALRWLASNAAEIGAARARMIKAERLVQHTEAIMMQLSDARSADARKADARASKKWLEAATEEAEAAGQYEYLRALREAAMARVEAWRTQEASNRARI